MLKINYFSLYSSLDTCSLIITIKPIGIYPRHQVLKTVQVLKPPQSGPSATSWSSQLAPPCQLFGVNWKPVKQELSLYQVRDHSHISRGFTLPRLKGIIFCFRFCPPKLMSPQLPSNKQHLLLPGLQSHCSFIKSFYYDEPSIELDELHHVIRPSQHQHVRDTREKKILCSGFPK